jgi:metal-responsive CopG/Arc/MetJ family transcriptional regulator
MGKRQLARGAQGGPKPRITVQLSESLLARLDTFSYQMGYSRSAVIVVAIAGLLQAAPTEREIDAILGAEAERV